MKNLLLTIIFSWVLASSILATNISGTISSDVTWTLSNSPYFLTGDVTIADGVTVTIEAGVEIEFSSALQDLFVDGNIQAIGTSIDSIYFRGQGTPRGNIIIRNSGDLEVSSFNYCVFENLAGNNASGSAIRIDIPTDLQNCSFFNPLDIVVDADATINFASSNRLDDIRIKANSMDSTTTLRNADDGGFYYRMLGDLIVDDLNSLTIEPGVEIQFSSALAEFFINGRILANGNSTDSITFRGLNPGQGGIRMSANGEEDLSEFSFCNFINLGSSVVGSALDIQNPTMVSNCNFINNILDVKARANFLTGFANNNSLDEIFVYGNTLSETTTWPVADSDGFRYVMGGDQTISDMTTLTIEAGVCVEFRSGLHEIFVNGTLNAIGTEADSIYFKGNRNLRGGIRLASNGQVDESIFSYCVFDSLGPTSFNQTALQIYQPVIMDHCRFNTQRNIVADGDFLGKLSSTNRLDVIEILSNSLDSTTVWPNADDSGFNYRLLGDQVVREGTTLEIAEGNNIVFPNTLTEIFVDGQLIANGSVSDSINFIGEETNAGGISIRVTGEVDTSMLSYCNFDSLGSTNVGTALRVGQPVHLSNSTFNNNKDIIADADFVWGMESSNRLNQIQLLSGSLDSTTVWPNADEEGFQYFTLGDQVVDDGNVLTIEPGVEFFFNSALYEINVEGQLIAQGTSMDSIKFTGAGDGAGGVYLKNTGAKDTSMISYCSFKNLASFNVLSGLRLDNPAFVEHSFFSNDRDVIALADHVWGFSPSNRLKEIEFPNLSLSTTTNWPVADDTGFIYRMLGQLILPPNEILTIEEGVEVLQNSAGIKLTIEGALIMEDLVPGKEVRFFKVP